MDAGTAEPRWLRVVTFTPAAMVAAFGGSGLLLAINRAYTPAFAFALGAAIAAAIVVLVWPWLTQPRDTPKQAHVAAAVGVAFIALITGWNAFHASQHVLVDRDPGAYTTEGRWIARTGTLEVRPALRAHGLTYESEAVFAMPNGTLQFQFAHVLPVLLAEAFAIAGNRALFHATSVLSGVGLLAFFMLAWRLLRRPWFAVAATVTLAVTLPQVSFSRDAYSEIPSQVLLFTALWMITSARVLPRPRVAFVAGLFVGALEMARIDAIVFLVGIPPLLALLWLRDQAAAARIAAFVGGLVPGLTLGLVDVLHHSGRYYADLSHNMKQLWLATALSVVVSAAIVLVGPKLRAPSRLIAVGAGVVVVLAGFAAWFLRPLVQHTHGTATGYIAALQQQERVTVDATRTYYEQSLHWMSWYLGPETVAVAIVAAGCLTVALLRGQMMHALGALALLLPASLLYLWKAEAVSDHLWVTRRFLVSAFPALVLLAFGAAAAVAARNSWWRAVAVAIVAVAIAYPLHALRPVRNMVDQRGFYVPLDAVCHTVGRNATILVVMRDLGDLRVPQMLRSYCGADVAVAKTSVAAGLVDLLATKTPRFFVVAAAPDVIAAVLPGASITTHVARNDRFLDPTLTHRPHAYATQSYGLSVARVR